MKSIQLALLSIFIFSAVSCGSFKTNKNFEGIIYSETTFTSKIDSISTIDLYGTDHSFDTTFMKDGFYKAISSTDFMETMLWRHSDTTVYFTHSYSPDTLWYNYTNSHPTELIEYELNYRCDKLVVRNNKGQVNSYYFSSELSLDPEFYKNCSNSATNEVQKLIKGVCLKLKMESANGTMISEATKIIKTKLKKNTFDLPEYKVLKELEY